MKEDKKGNKSLYEPPYDCSSEFKEFFFFNKVDRYGGNYLSFYEKFDNMLSFYCHNEDFKDFNKCLKKILVNFKDLDSAEKCLLLSKTLNLFRNLKNDNKYQKLEEAIDFFANVQLILDRSIEYLDYIKLLYVTFYPEKASYEIIFDLLNEIDPDLVEYIIYFKTDIPFIKLVQHFWQYCYLCQSDRARNEVLTNSLFLRLSSVLMDYLYKNNISDNVYPCLLNYLEDNIERYRLWCSLNIKKLDSIDKINYLRDMIIEDYYNKNNNANEQYII